MFRSLHISKTGMDASQFRLDVITNNLANVNTTGFKRSRGVFEDLMYQVIRQPGAQSSATTQLPIGLMVGTGSAAVASERIHTQGNLQNTENSFDIAINGKGFFQIELPSGGFAYTRDGSFKIDGATGNLVTTAGYPLVPTVTIDPNAVNVVISADGDVTQFDKSGTQVGTPVNIQIADFVNPSGLNSLGGNLYVETPASGGANLGAPNTAAFGALKQGFLENSNVNITQELVDMIQAQRAFEINSRGIKTSDEMLQRLSQL